MGTSIVPDALPGGKSRRAEVALVILTALLLSA